MNATKASIIWAINACKKIRETLLAQVECESHVTASACIHQISGAIVKQVVINMHLHLLPMF